MGHGRSTGNTPVRASLAAFSYLLLGTAAAAADGATPVGRWLTQGGDAVIEVAPCGAALCGRIVGIEVDHANDPIPTDWQGRSQCGLRIIQDAVRQGDAWQGRIVDPRNGDVYDARLSMAGDGRLHLRGYLGIPLFGQTQIWTRFNGALPADCRIPRFQPPASPGRALGRGRG
jgi:uncharacterized protein (DUF2147 family)